MHWTVEPHASRANVLLEPNIRYEFQFSKEKQCRHITESDVSQISNARSTIRFSMELSDLLFTGVRVDTM